MIGNNRIDQVRLSALGQLLYKEDLYKKTKMRDQELSDAIEDEFIKIEGISKPLTITPVNKIYQSKKYSEQERPQKNLSEYQGQTVDLYV